MRNGGWCTGRLALASAGCAASLLVGACGSSGTTTSSSATTASSAPATTTAPTSVPSLGGPAFCEQLVQADQKLTTTIPTLATDPQGAAPLVSTFDTLVSEAPAAIKSSVQDLATTVKAVAGAASNPSTLQQAESTLQAKAGPDAEAIGTWAGMHCTAG